LIGWETWLVAAGIFIANIALTAGIMFLLYKQEQKSK